jgi:hypothetical protein
MSFPANTFDAFSSWAMLPHVPKERIGAALDAIHDVLKPEALGFMAMREGTEEKQEAEAGRWFSYYTQSEFRAVLSKHGFNVLSEERKQSRRDLIWLTFFVTPNK